MELFSPVLAMYSGAGTVRLCRAFVASSLITLIKANTTSVKKIKQRIHMKQYTLGVCDIEIKRYLDIIWDFFINDN